MDIHLSIKGNADGTFTVTVGGFDEDENGDQEELEFNGATMQKAVASYHRAALKYLTTGNVKKKRKKHTKPTRKAEDIEEAPKQEPGPGKD